jgi:DegV family protein with EDD domain
MNIVMVPLTVRFGDDVFVDWHDVEPKALYDRMRTATELPQTSQPSAQQFVDAYHELAKTCDHIISIHCTGRLSGTVHSAEAAAKMVEKDIPVTVIDSEVLSLLLWGVLEKMDAARRAGQTLEQLVAIADDYKEKARLFFMVDTMKYLEMGGRIGKAQALLGSLLNIKPLMTLTDGGTPTPLGRAKGTKAGIRELVTQAKNYIDSRPADEDIVLVAAHADVPESLAYAESLFKEMGVRYDRYISGFIGAVVGSHLGPGTVAIGVL